MEMTPGARSLWEVHYERLTSPIPGVLGQVISRGAPHTIRLAMLYALLDQTASITENHLKAALAVWDAAARSAAHICGARGWLTERLNASWQHCSRHQGA
jgi:hypothetical protein